jgi:hypothetical protein
VPHPTQPRAERPATSADLGFPSRPWMGMMFNEALTFLLRSPGWTRSGQPIRGAIKSLPADAEVLGVVVAPVESRSGQQAHGVNLRRAHDGSRKQRAEKLGIGNILAQPALDRGSHLEHGRISLDFE